MINFKLCIIPYGKTTHDEVVNVTAPMIPDPGAAVHYKSPDTPQTSGYRRELRVLTVDHFYDGGHRGEVFVYAIESYPLKEPT